MIMTEPLQFTGMRGKLSRDEPLARHTAWRCGGKADLAYAPADRDDLAVFLRQLPEDEPLTVIGLGSNLLVRDGGVRGAVVLMHAPGGVLAIADGFVYAEAGVASPKLARFAAMHDCAEAEFLAGVPGTVGGALAMNAGCYGGETWPHVAKVELAKRDGTFVVLEPRILPSLSRSFAPWRLHEGDHRGVVGCRMASTAHATQQGDAGKRIAPSAQLRMGIGVPHPEAIRAR